MNPNGCRIRGPRRHEIRINPALIFKNSTGALYSRLSSGAEVNVSYAHGEEAS
jgi:hypothetical protein